MKEILHTVNFSGGLASAFVAVVVKRQGIAPLLLHTNTNFESDDTYVFMEQVSDHLGLEITWVADGRTPEQLFWDEHLLGNDLFPICSVVLKANQCENWLMEKRMAGYEPEFYLGLLPREVKRVVRIRRQYEHMGTYPATARFPLVDNLPLAESILREESIYAPLSNETLRAYFRAKGIETPRAYALGFAHNNCRNQCVRAGMGHWFLAYHQDYPAFAEARDREYKFCVEVYPKTRKGKGKVGLDERGFPLLAYLKRRRLR